MNWNDLLKIIDDCPLDPPPRDLYMSPGMFTELTRGHVGKPVHNLSFNGFKVHTATVPKRVTYDWSQCRSPARAQRRYKLGHPQRVIINEEEVAYLVNVRPDFTQFTWRDR